MLLAMILLPVLFAAAAFLLRADPPRRALLVLGAAAHAGLTAAAWYRRPGPALGGWLALDGIGLVFLSITSVLFLAAAVYAVGYLRGERSGRREDFVEGVFFVNAPEAVFSGTLLLFLSTMTFVASSQHFGLLWVAVEATTLASAPLIYFHRHDRSLEATWKYLMICSVGIALALLGNFFLAVAASAGGGEPAPLIAGDLAREAARLDAAWLKAAFLFFLVGYGTKMGLAPMHTWLPDAHSEAPSVVSALLSGALLNCAFLGILRVFGVCAAAGLAPFAQELLVGFGLLSMGFAAVFILGQADYKRLLAYSSVEHMGILALAVGLGGGAVFGGLFHAANHSLAKGMLFLLAGNILAAYRTKSAGEVRGVLRALPVTGVLWIAGFLAITGSPPFGPFLSELTILKAALDQGRGVVAFLYLALLFLAFAGMGAAALRMAQGEPAGAGRARAGEAAGALRARTGETGREAREGLLAVLPPALLGALVLLFGIYLPPAVEGLLHEAALALGGR
jgi:hydrogenase-4 component F